jgi:tetratricopeptide (TPR) repeat protein
MLITSWLAGFAIASAVVQAAVPPVPEIAVGGSLSATLQKGPDGRAARALFGLRPADGGTVTLKLESLDFDAAVELLRPDGELVARADLGGVGSDAWLVVELKAGTAYGIAASSRDGRAGDFVLSVVRGACSPPAGIEGVEAQIDYWTRGLERARTGHDVLRVLTCLRLSGQFAYQIGRYAFAMDRFREALELAEAESQTRNQPILAVNARFARAMVGALLLEKGDVGGALLESQRAYDALTAGAPAMLRCFVLQTLGDAYVTRLELPQAEALFEEELDAAQTGRQVLYEVLALERLGHLSARRNEPDAARSRLARALELAARIAPQEEMRARRVLADSLQLTGSGEEARAELERALDVDASPSEQRALALLQLGDLHRRAGHYDRARARFEAALDVCDTLGADLLASRVLLHFADLAYGLADDTTARSLLDQALECCQDPYGVGSRIDVLNELALLQGALGDSDRRRALHEKALELADSEGLADCEIRTRINLGQLLEERGDLTGARAMQQAAGGLAERTGAPTLAARVDVNLGYLDLLEGSLEKARRRSERALETFARMGLEEASLAPLETIARAAIEAGDERGASPAVARIHEILGRRAGLLQDADRASGWRSRYAWWAETLPQDLTLLRVAQSDPQSPERARAVREGFHAAGDWKGRALHGGIAARRPTPRDDPERALAAVLGPDDLVVEYAVGSDRLLAYALYGGELALYDLGPREAVESRAETFTLRVSDPSELGDAAKILELGGRLYDDLLRPVLDAHPQARSVTIVPTAALAALPFEALVAGVAPGHEGAPEFQDLEFVLERRIVTYAPSTTVLADLAVLPPKAGAGDVLVLADPIYPGELADRDAARNAPDPRGLARLTGTRDEAFTLARLLLGEDLPRYAPALLELLGERSGELVTPTLTLCLGAEASPERLRGDIGRFDVIHCAAHGYVDDENPENTGIALSFARGATGYLSVADVLGLELDAQLAVLSACGTARGRIRRGEGVQSLANAFLRAGARSVVASLWQVRDLESADFMKRFYDMYLGRREPPAQALREAKLEIVNAGRERGRAVVRGSPPTLEPGHPYFWAAPIYVGPPPRSER